MRRKRVALLDKSGMSGRGITLEISLTRNSGPAFDEPFADLAEGHTVLGENAARVR